MSSSIPISRVRRIVTRDVQPADEGSIATLNDLPPWMVEEARAIAKEARLDAVYYLRFHVRTHDGSNVEDFVQDVLRDGQDAHTWGIGDWLVAPCEAMPVTSVGAEMLQTLQVVEGERWFRLAPDLTKEPSDPSQGAVGVLRRGLRYWQHGPRIAGADLFSTEGAAIEPVPVEKLESSFRRWLARRMAWRARSYLASAGAAVAAPGIIDAIAAGHVGEVTRDAELAAMALAREVRAHGTEHDFGRRAGYLGPDSWYAG